VGCNSMTSLLIRPVITLDKFNNSKSCYFEIHDKCVHSGFPSERVCTGNYEGPENFQREIIYVLSFWQCIQVIDRKNLDLPTFALLSSLQSNVITKRSGIFLKKMGGKRLSSPYTYGTNDINTKF
jgi:hypothetical protein